MRGTPVPGAPSQSHPRPVLPSRVYTGLPTLPENPGLCLVICFHKECILGGRSSWGLGLGLQHQDQAAALPAVPWKIQAIHHSARDHMWFWQ